MPKIDLQTELERIRATQWDRQPAEYERLCSEYAIRCAHLEAANERMKKELDNNKSLD